MTKPVRTVAFDGAVEFFTLPPTLGLELRTRKLIVAAQEGGMLTDRDAPEWSYQSVIVQHISHTAQDDDGRFRIVVHAGDDPVLGAFKDWVAQLNKTDVHDGAALAGLLAGFLDIHLDIINAWSTAIRNAEQRSIAAAPEGQPLHALDDDQAVEATTPDSPLANPVTMKPPVATSS